MASIITAITAIVNGSIDWLDAVVTAVTATGNELLLFFCLCGFVGIGIGLLMRFVRR